VSMWQGQRIQEVDAEEAAAGREHNVLLDVREADEWAAGHAPAAVHLPMGQIPTDHGELPTDRPIACICRSGNRSGRVTQYLRSFGFDIVNVAGGMQSWAASGRPVVTDDGADGIVI
jgi:rhodanese-related sulfurtransferase